MKQLACLFFILVFWSCTQNTPETRLTLASGQVDHILNFTSDFVIPRNIDVWLPDNYSVDQEYAVLYMHDGQALFDAKTTWNGQEWGVDECLSQLIHQEIVRPTIVVGIWNTEFRHSEYFPQKPFEQLPVQIQDSLIQPTKRIEESVLFKSKINSDDYLKFIVKELKPFIDDKYATKPNAKNTFIAGSSMGGLISLYALCEYPNIFGGAACLSTHWLGTFETNNNPIPASFINYLENYLPEAKQHKIYFDYGTKTLDAHYEPYQLSVDSVMIKKFYTSQYWKSLKFEGADHSENAWKERLSIPLTFLLETSK